MLARISDAPSLEVERAGLSVNPRALLGLAARVGGDRELPVQLGGLVVAAQRLDEREAATGGQGVVEGVGVREGTVGGGVLAERKLGVAEDPSRIGVGRLDRERLGRQLARVFELVREHRDVRETGQPAEIARAVRRDGLL